MIIRIPIWKHRKLVIDLRIVEYKPPAAIKYTTVPSTYVFDDFEISTMKKVADEN